MKLLITSLLALASVAFAADECCQEGPTATGFIEPATPPVAGAATGTLKGRVVFDGERPKVEPLEIIAEKAKGCTPEGTQVDDTNRSLMIDDKGGIANVVVQISVDGADVKVPEEPIELDQAHCRFEPHVVCIPAGATVHFLNSDGVSHNVNLVAKKNDSWNKTIPAGGSTDSKFEKTDQVRIKCDIHPWMEGWMIVTDTPFVAVTGADGSFEVPDLPPGEYKVEYWHETLGKGSTKVTVAEGDNALEIKMSAAKKKGGGRRRRR